MNVAGAQVVCLPQRDFQIGTSRRVGQTLSFLPEVGRLQVVQGKLTETPAQRNVLRCQQSLPDSFGQIFVPSGQSLVYGNALPLVVVRH